jgi:hypothetical protein
MKYPFGFLDCGRCHVVYSASFRNWTLLDVVVLLYAGEPEGASSCHYSPALLTYSPIDVLEGKPFLQHTCCPNLSLFKETPFLPCSRLRSFAVIPSIYCFVQGRHDFHRCVSWVYALLMMKWFSGHINSCAFRRAQQFSVAKIPR